jgi:hypothetical protein
MPVILEYGAAISVGSTDVCDLSCCFLHYMMSLPMFGGMTSVQQLQSPEDVTCHAGNGGVGLGRHQWSPHEALQLVL